MNGKSQIVDSCDPNRTILRFLRTTAGLKGTKEGCASGDCGACTVLVSDGKEPYRAVNSCITLLGSVAGMNLVTVDALASGPDLHPVQQAMVDCHGSQCGFCTPGFVMSLCGLYEKQRIRNSMTADRNQILAAISGNLCRCTGYRPIIEAGQKMLSYEPRLLPGETCNSKASGAKAVLWDDSQQFFKPGNEQQLQQILARHPDATLVAGGTDIVLEISQHYRQFPVLVDLNAVTELTAVEHQEDALFIGAAATYSAVESAFEGLSGPFLQILHRLGSRQIRNRGTLGGNIANASPIADTPPVLLAWDAEIEIVNSASERRWVAMQDVYLGYRKTVIGDGEYIARIRIPTVAIARPHRFYKLSKRFEDDISAVMGAFVVEMEEDRVSHVRIAFGGMAATPLRAREAEAVLLGNPLDGEQTELACRKVMEAFSPLDDVRASSAYRSQMAVNLFRRALLELQSGETIDVFQLAETAREGLHA